MKHPLRYILPLFMLLGLASCHDEIDADADRDVDFCVRAAWQNGVDARSSRTLSVTNLLADGTDDIAIAYADYPAAIDVKCSDGATFTLTKDAALCTDHNDYWQYTPGAIYKDKKIERDDLHFTFKAAINGGDLLEGEADKNAITGKTGSGQRHMHVVLHHSKALLRFAFKLDPRYDKVRRIRVTNVNLNGTDCELADKVLTTDGQLIGYAYVDPTVVTATYVNTIRCTYNIYDRDAATDAHLTRKDVVAQNLFKLNLLKAADGTPVAKIQAGYYYDIRITLNPDYLYVLAEHDNKHITIE